MKQCLLKVNNLYKHYIVTGSRLTKTKRIDAVNGVSFAIYENESLGLIGESGCGKTTVSNIVLKLIELNQGQVLLFGQDINSISENQMRHMRKDIQIVFQHSNNALDPMMTMGELIAEPLKIHKIVDDKNIDAEVDRLLGLVGLPTDEKWKYPHQLSGGQNQRIIIARAISTRPKLIVCDEPVSALDVSVQGQILNLLVKLKEELSLTYLFISHDINVVRYMCEHIAVMYNGKIVERGDTKEVISNPQHKHTKNLLDSIL
jgi:ABC-type oligopeptide transport system ATPase subunit